MKFKRWFACWKSVLTDIVTGVGLYWLLVEISSYSTNSQVDVVFKNLTSFSIAMTLIVLIALYKNRPRYHFSYKLRDKDVFVEVQVGDAFNNNGALIIPINDHFDTSLGGNVKKAKSVQNKLISEYYSGKCEHLDSDIQQKINTDSLHEIGTTIEVEQQGKKFYLLVNSKKKPNNRVESTIDDFLLSLTKVWDYIALESGRDDAITIPIISTRHGRITDLNRTKAIKEIIRSFIESSKKLNIADRLIVCIHPNDLEKGKIDLDSIDDFLRLSCLHYREVLFEPKVEGTEISDSEIQSINN